MTSLHYKSFGDSGRPVFILHGLFGSLENWSTQARTLSENFFVLAVDLRNHGRSPHRLEMGYPNMASDVVQLMDQLNIDSAHIIGHSMGGKTAMQLALDYPQRVDKLVVVDIAPRQYPPHHSEIFEALGSLDLAELASRTDADRQIAEAVPEPAIRSFLLKNLQRTDHGFSWKMNLAVLREDYDSIAAAITADTPFPGETVFIKGGDSNYIAAADKTGIEQLFPKARGKIIQNAGHWPHVEKADTFARIVHNFLVNN